MAAESNSCCSCCSGFILTTGLTALFLWLSLRVDEPKLYIDHIYVPTLNKSLNTHSSNSTLLFTLKLANPNKDKGIQYDAVLLRFGIFHDLNETFPLGNASVDGFYQGYQKKAFKPGSLAASGNLTAIVNGGVHFRVDYSTAVKYKVLLWYTKRDRLWGGANVEIGNSGEKVHPKPIRLGGKSPPRIESGAPSLRGRYRALLLSFLVLMALLDQLS